MNMNRDDAISSTEARLISCLRCSVHNYTLHNILNKSEKLCAARAIKFATSLDTRLGVYTPALD